jgi:hypothetical protein
MNKVKELEKLIEMVSLSIVCLENEESLFRRFAGSFSDERANSLCLEIASDLAPITKKMNNQRNRLENELYELKKNREANRRKK